jgi:hypothetical protein
MSSRIGLCSFAGGVALFLWGALSWAVLPMRADNLQEFNDEDKVAAVLKASTDGHGVYVYPKDKEKLAGGPFAFVIFRPGATMPMSRLMVRGFLVCVLAAGLMSNLLLQSSVTTYGGRILFCVVVCLTAGVLVRLSDWNWRFYPTSYVLIELLHLAVSGAVLGLAIGKLIVPRDSNIESMPSLVKS